MAVNVDAVRPMAVAAVASLSAGAIHAAAIGSHDEHRQAALLFTAVAGFQLAWGAVALVRSSRHIALIGALGNVALVVGWAVAKSSGLAFVDGLDEAEPVQTADGLAAGLAAVAAIGALLTLRRPVSSAYDGRWPGAVLVTVVAATALPGMWQAGRHAHAHGDAAPEAHGVAHTHDAAAAAAVAPAPYDPSKPIDLGGVPGVTPEQQARAENLVAITLLRLPRWSDPAVAEAAGFRSIGDGFTGDEHFINPAFVVDDVILDPDRPESLVYRNRNGVRTLEAAMYMLPVGTTLDDVPDIGGKLTQWHIHDNLCFRTTADGPKIAGLTDAGGSCSAGLVKGPVMPMIHVWITPHRCGPFAALEGVGGGQVKAGEARLCDHAHGAVSSSDAASAG